MAQRCVVSLNRVGSPHEAAATPRQATHFARSSMPTPVPNATPMPRPSAQQAPSMGMAEALTPLAPSMVARRLETGADAQLARWETGMNLLQQEKEDDVSCPTLDGSPHLEAGAACGKGKGNRLIVSSPSWRQKKEDFMP